VTMTMVCPSSLRVLKRSIISFPVLESSRLR
jgi:hypothetical protein